MPLPHGMPAAALSGINTVTAQGAETRDYCPHSTLLRPHLRLVGGFGAAGAENSREGRTADEAEEAGAAAWGGKAPAERGWLSLGQRQCRGNPAALRGWASRSLALDRGAW